MSCCNTRQMSLEKCADAFTVLLAMQRHDKKSAACFHTTDKTHKHTHTHTHTRTHTHTHTHTIITLTREAGRSIQATLNAQYRSFDSETHTHTHSHSHSHTRSPE